jgi:hypothetical protein
MREFWIVTAMMLSLLNMNQAGATSVDVVASGAIQKEHTRAVTTKVKRKTTLKGEIVRYGLNDDEIVIDDDITFGRNRNKIKLQQEDQDELSDYVKFRLFLARQLAMRKYHQTWG